MAEKMSEVYGAYDMEIVQSMRGRGAIILKTDKGIYQLKTPEVNESRLTAEYNFKESLYETGFTYIDRCIKNREGELFTFDRYGNPYVMRSYFEGRECNITSRDEIRLAVDNLAKLHGACSKIFAESEGDVHIRITSDFKKRNNELKRVWSFLQKRKGKIEFEERLLNAFPYFYDQAVCCERKYSISEAEEVLRHLGYCHGMYDHHCLIVFDNNKMATINFDKFYVGNQLSDLYHFLRKTVEKNGYSFELAVDILEEYSSKNKLEKKDLQYIYMMYLYPEKFYKLVNQYMNSPKTRISPKMSEKLERIISEERNKLDLLGKLNEY